ncbi:STAS domain-containing protein [Nocardioides sp. SYSU DS0663]|uniref:STAS domain-containing protein n=1 Tax=Nocardioides sp. SYSU DS0663 TaxID=3416445 RepID=UPI003F4C254E
MQSEVSTAVVSASALVTVSGELDLLLASSLRAGFEHVVDQGVETVLLDISGITFADTAGLDGLLWCRDRAGRAGVQCRLTAPPPALLRLVRLTRSSSLVRGPRLTPLAWLARRRA